MSFYIFMKCPPGKLQGAGGVDARGRILPTECQEEVLSETDLGWLEAWRRAEWTPVFHSEIPGEWEIIEAMWLCAPLRFRYLGGSEPGMARVIIPTSVYRVRGYSALYFQGWCELRQGKRVFRADRCEFLNNRTST